MTRTNVGGTSVMEWSTKMRKAILALELVLLFLLLLSNFTDGGDQVTETDDKADFTCPDQFGYFPDKKNCSRYFVCVFGLAVHESCTGGLYFSTDLQTCDWPRNVMCNQGSGERSNNSESSVTISTSTISTIKIVDHRTTKTTPLPTTSISLSASGKSTTFVYKQNSPSSSIGTSTDRINTTIKLVNVDTVTKSIADIVTSDPLQGKKDSTIQHATEEDELSTLTEIYDVLRDKTQRCFGCQQSAKRGNQPEDDTHYQQDGSVQHTERQHNLPLGVTSSRARTQNAHINKPEVTVLSITPDAQTEEIPSSEMGMITPDHVSIPEYFTSEEIEDSRDLDQTDYSSQGGDTEFTEPPEENHESPEENQEGEPSTKPTKSLIKGSNAPSSSVSPSGHESSASRCDPSVCNLPRCFCGGNHLIPGGLKPEEVPQMVMITFDDAINDINWSLYESLLYKGRKNPNGCPILSTFYVSHEWTDYSRVQTLYSDGHEIASHSITHPTDADSFTKEQWYDEIVGQKEILTKYAAIRPEEIRGMRAPFLQIGGNQQYDMMKDNNFTYDSSMPVYENRPPYWPYTLDHAVGHECMINPCPSRSFPGIWELPLVMWVDINGGRCSMADACAHPPTAEGVYTMMVKNFERHYNTNRAPFGLFYHAGWFATPHHREGFEAFLNQIVTMDDVYIVTSYQLVEWLRKPTPLNRIKTFDPWLCKKRTRIPPCKKPNVCNLWFRGGVRYMKTCQPCPIKYPWVENPKTNKTTSNT